MTKVCYICALLGIEKRGVESYSYGLVKNLLSINKDLSVDLISGAKTDLPVHSNILFPIKPHVLKGLLGTNYFNDHLAIFCISPTNIFNLICSISILKILMNKKYDYYVPTNYFELIVCKIARFLKREKSKIIFVGHAGPGHDDYKAVKLQPDIFIELTKPSFDWAKKILNKKTKLQLIPIGIDTDKFNYNTVLKAQSPFKNNNKIALFIGAFVQYKRPELVIKLLEKKKDINLIMIGQGPLLNTLKEKYKSLVSEGRLLFTGSVAHELVPTYLKLCDISFMVSTNRENSPTVAIESMTMHKPVIATKYDRTEWILQDGGVLTDPEDTNKLVNAVNICFENYSEISTKAYERSKYFSWQNVVKLWNEILE